MGIEENVLYLVIYYYEHERSCMYGQLGKVEGPDIEEIIEHTQDLFHVLMGNHPIGTELKMIVDTWSISGKYITSMYNQTITNRTVTGIIYG